MGLDAERLHPSGKIRTPPVGLLVPPDFSKDEFGDKTMGSRVGVIVGWVQYVVT